MNYQLEITIKKPIQQVIEAFDNAQNLKHWQKGFISYEPLTSEQGQVGSKAKLIYKMGNKNIEMIETITHKDLPKEFHGTYKANGIFNIQKNYFLSIDENTTKWVCQSEFQFKSLGLKLFSLIMPGAFKKQSFQFMQDFKNFAENEISVSHA